MRLSVVIPTLGGCQLKGTIEAFQKNSIVPEEILLCIPNVSELQIDISIHQNVKVIETHKRGQVYQRIAGFLAAKNNLVLQMDDDIILKNNTIEQLINCIEASGEKSAVAPTYLQKNTNLSLYERNNTSILWRIVYWIMNGKNGFQPGVISLSGINFGLCFNNSKHLINASEWLPGGCVLHRKENLILSDYFPFKGKAYTEDIIHSFLLRKQGIKLYVAQEAVAYVDIAQGAESLTEFFKQYNAVKYATTLFKKSLIRMRLYYLINLIFFLVKRNRK